MLRELAEVLGIEEHSLYAAIHAAAQKSGRQRGSTTISMGRDVFRMPGEFLVAYSPAAESVVLIYGPTDKVGKAGYAAKLALENGDE